MDMSDLAFLMGGDFEAAPDAASDYRNIWVVAEVAEGGASRVTRQVMGKARELGVVVVLNLMLGILAPPAIQGI